MVGPADLPPRGAYDVTPDGKRAVATLVPEGGNTAHLTFLLNFFDELRHRAPPAK